MKKIITLSALLTVAFTAAKAQIPNSSFENWTTIGSYIIPDNWDNLNPITSTASVYTCEKGTPGAPHGNYYLMLTTKMVATTMTPGVAVCGKLDVVAKVPKSGFPFTGRPASLTGKWQYMSMSATDSGYAGVWLTKWNPTTSKRDTIASTLYTLPGMVMSWSSFNLPLTYVSNNAPDSAIIGFSSSGLAPAANSYLHVDSLNFADNAASVPLTTYGKYTIAVAPNPAKDHLAIDFGIPVINDVQIAVMDIFGKVIRAAAYGAGQRLYNIGLKNISPGMYFVKVKVGEDIQTKRLEIQ